MKLTNKLTTALIGAGLVSAAHAVEISDAEFAALKKQLAELDQKVRVLQREREIDGEAATAAAKAAPKISLGASGFNLSSGDTNFTVQIHGVAQLDSRIFFNDGNVNGNDGFLIRRARPIISGTVFHDFDFNFTPEFGGSTVQIQDAWLNYRYSPWLQVQAGKFKSPVGLEQLQSDPVTSFNERSLATDLVPNRDLGVAVKGEVFKGAASYTLGLFNGATDFNGTTVNTSFQDNRAVEGRLFFQPWKNSDTVALRGLGFGVGGSYLLNNPATNSATGLTPGFTTDGQQRFFAFNSRVNAQGDGWRISPQAYYYHGPLGLMAEYVVSEQQARRTAAVATPVYDLENRAFEITGSWVLTGEDATYAGVTPRHPFDPRNGGWGAWQLVARYAELDVDNNAFLGTAATRLADPTKSAAGAESWAVGLNWFLNKNIRANLSFSHTTFSGYNGTKIAGGNVAAQDENILFTRLQLAF
jgi:phosphate-selective porin OprO/OprP